MEEGWRRDGGGMEEGWRTSCSVWPNLDLDVWDLQSELNAVDHRTEPGGAGRLVVRRGRPFSLKLQSGGFLPDGGVACTAETGPEPSERYGTRASFGLSAAVDASRWSAAATAAPGEPLTLTVCAAPDAPIGRYTLSLGGAGRVHFILLFNPWCTGDAVFMEDQSGLEEYVTAQDGIVYRGSYKHPVSTPWNYGQFEDGILDVCLRILDMNPKHLRNPGKDCSGRRSPVYVSRVLSAMASPGMLCVNCNGDRGVLLGCWTGDYEGGASPLSWGGSAEILRRWAAAACQPVRYGQCWVFAAVACSVSRALGIPCRVVTNYLSAHDNNGDLVIERHVNEKGEALQATEMIW
ncbi:Protein-glutamine gamma-glutamyltransferase 2 [Liparis tanakae]|uniref:Protein-glutamine gamma-glutamyltransferase 2 n=1 Tax=Liparis tanakae TaxID=230148 RepID=A0A4Z2GKC5_9TELE|nr:Protein-glutamine gamma-glutamyltransferase 2 [Liparis tanakae]